MFSIWGFWADLYLLAVLVQMVQNGTAEDRAVLSKSCRNNPMLATTKRAMLAVHGMGKERYRRYGRALLDAVRAWTGA